MSAPRPASKLGPAIWLLVFLAILLVGVWLLGGAAAHAQTAPPDCVALMLPGDSRMFVRADIPHEFANQTPPPMRCQSEVRAMPLIPLPSGRLGVAVWIVDVDTHVGIRDIRVTIDGTTHPTNPGGLATFTPLKYDPMTISFAGIPLSYTPLSPYTIPGGRPDVTPRRTSLTDKDVFIMIEMRKRTGG